MAWEGYQSAGTSGRDSGKPGAGLRNLAGFPILMRGPSAGQTQALVRPASPPPGLQLSTHLRGSSRGSRPAPARLPIPGPGGDGRAGERRAPRPGGRSGPRGCAGGGRRAAGARTAEARARRPRRVLCPLARPRYSRSAPTCRSPAPAQSDWPSVGPVPPPAKSHWTPRKRRFVRPLGGRGFQRAGAGRGGAGNPASPPKLLQLMGPRPSVLGA